MSDEYIGYAKRYFDYARRGPLHPLAKKAIKDYIETDYITEDLDFKIIQDVRRKFSKLIGCSKEEISLIPNVSLAAAAVAYSLPFRGKYKILTNNLEFASNRFPWQVLQRFGYNITTLVFKEKIDESKLIKFIDTDTELIAISHILYTSGYRVNIEEIYDVAKSFDAYLFLDAYQSIGAIEVKSHIADFIATGSGKWLLGLPGSGILYINRRLLNIIIPPFRGWFSQENINSYNSMTYIRAKNGRVMEAGYPPILGYVALNSILDEYLRIGIKNIERRISSLTSWLIDELNLIKNIKTITPDNPNRRGGIISINIGRNTYILYQYLVSKNYKLSIRDGNIRVSIHYYTSEDDILSFINDIKQFLKKH